MKRSLWLGSLIGIILLVVGGGNAQLDAEREWPPKSTIQQALRQRGRQCNCSKIEEETERYHFGSGGCVAGRSSCPISV